MSDAAVAGVVGDAAEQHRAGVGLDDGLHSRVGLACQLQLDRLQLCAEPVTLRTCPQRRHAQRVRRPGEREARGVK